MEENFWPGQTSCAVLQAGPVQPKSNELRIVEALESIAGELFHLRQNLEVLTDGGNGFGSLPAAIRTTGR